MEKGGYKKARGLQIADPLILLCLLSGLATQFPPLLAETAVCLIWSSTHDRLTPKCSSSVMDLYLTHLSTGFLVSIRVRFARASSFDVLHTVSECISMISKCCARLQNLLRMKLSFESISARLTAKAAWRDPLLPGCWNSRKTLETVSKNEVCYPLKGRSNIIHPIRYMQEFI
jgi:hypothetical protein